MKLRDLPNLITGLRILLVAPLLWFLQQQQYAVALCIFIVAGASDGIDGFLAKHHGWTSRLGGILDPLADKLLLIGCIVTLGWLGQLPVWLVILVILRDLVIMGGAISYHYFIEPFQPEPLAISKANTLAQLALVLAIIFSKSVLSLPEAFLAALIGITALTTVLSGTAYVWEWTRRALHKKRRVDIS